MPERGETFGALETRGSASWIQGECEFGEYRREYATAITKGHTPPTGNNPKIQRGEMEKQEQVQPRLENYSAVKEKRRMRV